MRFMDCEKAKLRLGELLDGELAGDVRKSVEAHLDQCAGCRAELDSMRSMVSRLGPWEDVAVPVDSIWSGVERRLGPARGPRLASKEIGPRTAAMRLLRWRPLAAAAVIVLAVGLGWLLWSSPWQSTASAAMIDFRPILERSDGDLGKGLEDLIAVYGGRPTSLEEAASQMRIRVHAPATLPGDLRLASTHFVNVGRSHRALAFYFVGQGGQLLILQCPAHVVQQFGDRECLPCQVGTRQGMVVREGPYRLMHFKSENVCVCVLSTLDEASDLPAALNAVQIDF
jgi:hypothetical protein